MKLIVGLGNPGTQYEKTRHNAGFMAVDRMAQRHAPGAIARSRFNALAVEAEIKSARAPGSARAILLKPLTFMNRSGQSVVEAARFYKLDPVNDVIVIVDDVYLDCGAIRLLPKGGSGGHNGLEDIQRALGSEVYPRCRIGVDPPGMIPQADYVLGRFTEEQLPKVDTALGRAVQAVELWAVAGIDAAMNAFNAPDRPPRAKPPRPLPKEGEKPPDPPAAISPST